MRTRIVALAFVASMLAAPSFAADFTRPAPLPIVAKSLLTGFYVGGNIGFGNANRHGCAEADFLYNPFPAPRTCREEIKYDVWEGGEATPFNYNQHGWLVGAQMGLNHSLGPIGGGGLVVGAEVNAALSGVTGVLNSHGLKGTGDWHWLASADAKLGWGGGNWLLYLKAGISIADFGFSGAACTFNVTHQGTNWGIGGEMAVSSNNSVFVDWTHHDFEGKDIGCGSAIVPVAVYVKPKMDVLRVGFNHYFN